MCYLKVCPLPLPVHQLWSLPTKFIPKSCTITLLPHDLQMYWLLRFLLYVMFLACILWSFLFVQEEQRLCLSLSVLEQDLVDMEQQLQDAVKRQQKLMGRVNMLRKKETHVKEENERLLKAKVTANHINGNLACPEQNFVNCYNKWKWLCRKGHFWFVVLRWL